MHAVARVSAAVALGAIACLSAGAAMPQTMALPDVSVTAPPVVPSFAKPTPFFGNTRVEEDKWPEVPCTVSRIDLAVPATCKRGPRHEDLEKGDAQGSRQQSNCNIAHDVVISTVGHLAIEADVMVFDPYYVSAIGHQRSDCAVEGSYTNLRDDFPDMNQMTRQGGGWRNFVQSGDLATMEFSVGAENCVAIEQRGPRWGVGYIYLIHASGCRRDRRVIEPGDVGAILGALQIRPYDPNGNLRSPPSATAVPPPEYSQ